MHTEGSSDEYVEHTVKKRKFPLKQLESWAVDHFDGLEEKLRLTRRVINFTKAAVWVLTPKRIKFFVSVSQGLRNLIWNSPNYTHMQRVAEVKRKNAAEHHRKLELHHQHHEKMQNLSLAKREAKISHRETHRDLRIARHNGTLNLTAQKLQNQEKRMHMREAKKQNQIQLHEKHVKEREEMREVKKRQRMTPAEREEMKLIRAKIGKAIELLVGPGTPLGNNIPQASRGPLVTIVLTNIMKMVKKSGRRYRKLVKLLLNSDISMPNMTLTANKTFTEIRKDLADQLSGKLPALTSQVVEAFREAGFTFLPKIADAIKKHGASYLMFVQHAWGQGQRMKNGGEAPSREETARLFRDFVSLQGLPAPFDKFMGIVNHTAGLLERTSLSVRELGAELYAQNDKCGGSAVLAFSGLLNTTMSFLASSAPQRNATLLLKKVAKTILALESCPEYFMAGDQRRKVMDESAAVMYLLAEAKFENLPETIAHVARLTEILGLEPSQIADALDELLAFTCTVETSDEHVQLCKDWELEGPAASEEPAEEERGERTELAAPREERRPKTGAPAAEAAEEEGEPDEGTPS